MKTEEVEFLSQLVSSLEKAQIRLEEAYNRGNYAEFDRLKDFINQVQRKILGVIR